MLKKEFIKFMNLLIGVVFASKDYKADESTILDDNIIRLIESNEQINNKIAELKKYSIDVPNEMINEYIEVQEDLKKMIDDHLVSIDELKLQIDTLKDYIAERDAKYKNLSFFQFYSKAEEREKLSDLKERLIITESNQLITERILIKLNNMYNLNQDVIKDLTKDKSNILTVKETKIIEIPISIDNIDQSVIVKEPIGEIDVIIQESVKETNIIENPISINTVDQTVIVEKSVEEIDVDYKSLNPKIVDSVEINKEISIPINNKPTVIVEESLDDISNINPIFPISTSKASLDIESNIIPDGNNNKMVYIENESKLNNNVSGAFLNNNNSFEEPIRSHTSYSNIIFDRFNNSSEPLISMENNEQITDDMAINMIYKLVKYIREQILSLITKLTWLFQKITFSSNCISPESYFIITLAIIFIIFYMIRYRSKTSTILSRIPIIVILKKKTIYLFIITYRSLKGLILSNKLTVITIKEINSVTKKPKRRLPIKLNPLNNLV